MFTCPSVNPRLLTYVNDQVHEHTKSWTIQRYCQLSESDGENMSPSPGAKRLHVYTILIYILCLHTYPTNGVTAVLQKTVVEDPISLNTVSHPESSTQSPFVSLLVCG